MIKAGAGKTVCWLIVLWAVVCQANAQTRYTIQHQSPPAVERNSETAFQFSVSGINSRNVDEAYLFYRTGGASTFRQKPARLNGTTFEVPLAIPDTPASVLEYFFLIIFDSGEELSYPSPSNAADLLATNIIDKEETGESTRGSGNKIDYTILSPEPGQKTASSDVVAALALFYEMSDVDTTKNAFRFFFDGEDVTAQSKAGTYFFSYAPEDVLPGLHTASLKLVSDTAATPVVSWTFEVSDAGRRLSFPQKEDAGLLPSGRITLTAKNRVVAGNGSDRFNAKSRIFGKRKNIRYSAYGFLTSQDEARLQPQNRYGGELYAGDWFELQAGHIYPNLSPMTITGRRINGFNTEINLFEGAVNLQFLHGSMRRGIPNLYQPVTAHQEISDGTVTDTTYVLGFQRQGVGTYRQKVTGARLGYEKNNRLRVGVNVLKVQDDTTSLRAIRNFGGLMQHQPDLVAGLSALERRDLEQNPGQLNVAQGETPKGNMVAETDVEINLDQHRVQLRADAAISMVNNNIRGGTLDAERAEQLGFWIDKDDENLLNRLSWLIIVNENMNADPFRYSDTDSARTGDLHLPGGIWATESELYLNYFKNNLRIQYRRIGPDFDSFANSTIRRDIEGFTISDRFSLFDDQLYLTLGYENLHDNVTEYKETTISTVTLRSNVSWYPLNSVLPNLNVDLMKRSRKNGIDLYNPYLSSPLLTAAVQNYRLENSDLIIVRRPLKRDSYRASLSLSQQLQFWNMTHNLNANYSISRTIEALYAYGDERSQNISLSVRNRFGDWPLDTNIGFNYNKTGIGEGLTDVRITGVNLGGTAFLLDDRLNIDASIAWTQSFSEYTSLMINDNGTPEKYEDDYYMPDIESKTVSESNSYIFGAGASYDLNEHHTLLIDARFNNVISRRSAYEVPTDRLVEARYVVRF